MEKKLNAKKTKKKIKKKEIIVKTITIVAIISVITVAYNFINNLETINIKVEEYEFYKYFAGEKINYSGTLKMTRKNDITELITENGAVLLNSVPLYYKEQQDKVLLPEVMAIVFPLEDGEMYKINSLANVYVDYGTVYLEKGKLKKELQNAFLYDGDGVYFFIDRSTVIVNGTEYELSPLSYVKATYGGHTEIYNAETEEYTYIPEVEGDIIAKAPMYKINLSIDSVQWGKKDRLLVRNLKELNNL